MPPRLPRRAALAAPALLLAARASGQPAWPAPGQTIALVIPYAAGGASDVVGRVAVDGLSALGANAIMEHRPGASTSIAARYVARAKPDGQTLLLGTNVTFTMAPVALRNPGYDIMADFAHATLVTETISVLVANPRWDSLETLVAAAKARPGELSYATWGIGTSAHLAAVDFCGRAGIEMTHVPFNGSPPAMIDVIAGRIDCMFALLAACKGHVEAGRLRPLAAPTATRIAALPGVRTLEESGFPGFRMNGWYSVSGPAGTPAAILGRIDQAMRSAFGAPEARALLDRNGLGAAVPGQGELHRRIQEELALNRGLMQRAGIQPE